MSPSQLISHITLEKPLRVTEQQWPDNVQPLVSVLCTAYQHVHFIRQAIDGFLMQETTFPIEILIHDDASTDGTAEIVKEYADRYPILIKATLQKENQFSRGNRPGKILSNMSRGGYLAICEGDDYWISSSKLQKQVQILQDNQDISMVFHNAWVMHEDSRKDYFLNRGLDKERFTLTDIIEREWFIATASILHRRYEPLPTEITNYSMVGDMLMHVASCMNGDAYFLNEVGSVYRRHVGGVSDEMWKGGEYHHEKFRPNNIWMYWMLAQNVLPAACTNAVEQRIRAIADCIIEYGASKKIASASRDQLRQYIYSLIMASKPPHVSDDNFTPGSRLRDILDSQVDSYWRMRRLRKIFINIKGIKNRIISILCDKIH
jgi:hypothetical protein